MKHRLFAIASLFVSLFPIAPASSAQRVEYEKFVLDNGLTVILHEDHRLPQAAVNVWYRVGSKDEAPGRSGFAHLFEHLMFMGTERVPGSAFDDIMEAGGGSNNASTAQDRTNYYESGPAELLPTLLWLEADRLEALGRAMTQEKLDKQREIVRNERRQTSENQPYGRAYLKSFELLYPPGHPYHLPVIGSHEDLQAATVEDVTSFFDAYYVPSNAALVVAGDFDPAQTKALISELFGSLPRGADVEHKSAEPVELEREIVHTSTDAVQFAQTSMIWHSPPGYQPGDAELDLLAAVLSDGISSRLYQKLVVEEEVAVEVEAYQSSRLLGSTFTISALAREGVELGDVEQAIDEVLAALRRDGPRADEVERQKAKIEHATLQGLESVREKADRLNAYQFHFGEPDSFARDLDRYRNASAEGVREWTRRVLDPARRLVMRVLPEAPEAVVNARDRRPEPTAAAPFAPEGPTAELTLANGVRVMHWERSDLPLVALHLLLPTGSIDDPEGRGGLAALTADMLDEGAGGRSAMDFADALDLLGAEFGAGVDPEWTHVRLAVLRRNLEPALALAADALLRPAFDASEWERVHDLHVQGLRQALDDPNQVAERVARLAFFGEGHPYGRAVDGTIASAESIALDEVRRFHAGAYTASGAVLLAAGDLDAAQARTLFEDAFGALPAGTRAAKPAARELPAPANEGLRVVLVHRPDAVQTAVRVFLPAAAYRSEDRPERELLALILGGTFTSRLNQNLREQKGYAYGASSRFAFGPSASYLNAGSNARTDVTGAAIGEILKELRALRAGDVRDGEVEKAKSTTRQRTVAAFATLDGVLDAAAEQVMHGLPFSALAEELSAVAGTDTAELNRLASSTLPLEQALILLVGDREQVLPQLEGLDLPAPDELDAEGRVVAKD